MRHKNIGSINNSPKNYYKCKANVNSTEWKHNVPCAFYSESGPIMPFPIFRLHAVCNLAVSLKEHDK